MKTMLVITATKWVTGYAKPKGRRPQWTVAGVRMAPY